ncbi:MAG: DUF3011 domain-containing protein [Xanthomonadaceae bacterium]|jgi:hypothetical protein|nr:DUF3011 domain-containing protein [Xanthomonadaceae bacterium]
MIRIILSTLATIALMAPCLESRAQSSAANTLGGWSSESVLCYSNNNRRTTCNTPFNGRPSLVQNISGTRCMEGVNFGGGNGTMWVDGGCRGRFIGSSSGRPGGGNHQNNSNNGYYDDALSVVRCESNDRKARVCNTNFRGNARLVRQMSSSPCVEGQSWGQRRGSVWVSNGCRAEFVEEGRGNNRPGRR